MEKGGITDYIHIRMPSAVSTKTLHGILMSLGLSHVKSDLMLEVFPIIGDRIVHVYGIPDNVG